ncbi:MAG TPA: hypothetical protein VGC72_08570 [Candidatus Elarobacter sp.]
MHNNEVNRLADDALVKGLAFLVHALKVPLHRGKVGSDLHGVSKHGLKYTIDSDHVPFQQKVLLKDSGGRIQRFTAPSVEAVNKQLKTMGLSVEDPDIRLLEVMSEAPDIYFKIGFDRSMFPGVVKTAYHFVACQGAGVSAAVSTKVLATLANPDDCADISFPLVARDPQQDHGHELVAYPAGSDTIVTVELFGIYRFAVLLAAVTLPHAVRCYQDVGTGALTVEPVKAKPPSLTRAQGPALDEIREGIAVRLRATFQYVRQRDALKVLELAGMRAFALACKEYRPSQERFLTLLEQELHLSTSKQDLITYLMDLARRLPPMPAPPY